MADLNSAFEAATIAAKSLPQKPDNETLLKLYALYKQGTSGDVSGSRPGFTDFVGRAKFDAWAKLKGTSAESAQQSYVDLVNSLQGGASA